MFKLYNTLRRRIEQFEPINSPHVGLYTCGPTVYDYTHIGHLRKYVGDDLLKRILIANGFDVKHVQNITDVGHLTSDADEGDDKLDKRAKEKGMSVWEVAKFFEQYHFKSLDQVNVLRPNIVCRATEHIGEQIKLIEKLVKKGFTYQTKEAVYFDTSKFPDYGKLSGQKLEEKVVGVRKEVVVDPNKKNPADFVLWFFTVGHFQDHTMRWPSPWGEGFPGWHIECSAMSMEYLGDSFDIHTGGIDHIPVHHPNEIAQSEAATGKTFVKYWVHHNFLIVEGGKMSKSKGSFYRIDDILEKGFDPLALRYLFLTAHYRDKLNFTWQSLEASQNALNNLREEVREWDNPKIGCAEFEQKFIESVNNDLSIPQAVAVMWDMVTSDYPTSAKARSILEMDKVLGLKLDEFVSKPLEIPQEAQRLVKQREQAREKQDFKKSDDLRKEIKKLGFEVEDTPSGPRIVVN
ncbi:cysteine--tRNA ligase [Candidatus Daviesbacteria bacterium RIFCSPHIGHO2_02_FULL_39_12]|uniref:Cysteine--tRNA ligase n=2 Tax=Candidatus Daviesiibacteriota TaxID=1752718 RepID=A0A1F5JDR4_9BACT|nr:MAG: cysteine--tRNA ligase [Candidatus Daviesbacteria bacterium RIFCSPHIGHO2_02_FULL_39_12]OGE71907.1 MAG: cysteine--tRNA ligase [Candidatus Daviesbacteria bacterium RIFCSPLOWO2_02_FULL_38_15]